MEKINKKSCYRAKNILLRFFFVSIISLPVTAQTLYIDPVTGSNSNPGTIDQPLKTVESLSTFTWDVALIKRGTVMTLTDGKTDLQQVKLVNLSNKPIGAYGEGAKPIIQNYWKESSLTWTRLEANAGQQQNVWEYTGTDKSAIRPVGFGALDNVSPSASTITEIDPLLDTNRKPSEGSPALDSGINWWTGMLIPDSALVDFYGNSLIKTNPDMGAVQGEDPVYVRNDLTKSAFNVYPTLFENFVNIETSSRRTSIELYNMLGERVRTVSDFAGGEVNLSDISKGIYILRIISENKQDGFKIIKK